MFRFAVLIALVAAPGFAESVIATRTIRPQEIIMPEDVRLDQAEIPGAYRDVYEVVGQEAVVGSLRSALSPGVTHGPACP